jgi:hypothetical protein
MLLIDSDLLSIIEIILLKSFYLVLFVFTA